MTEDKKSVVLVVGSDKATQLFDLMIAHPPCQYFLNKSDFHINLISNQRPECLLALEDTKRYKEYWKPKFSRRTKR